MGTKSTNLELNIFNETDAFDVSNINYNFNTIDAKLGVDYVIGCGKSDNNFWYYRKWNSGRVELWGTSAKETVSEWAAFGVHFMKQLSSPEMPFAVYDQLIQITPLSQGNGLYFAMPFEHSTSKNTVIDFQLVSMDTTSSQVIDNFEGYIRYYVEGRWK